MQKYICKICGYIYNPEENDNISFENLPSDWLCPVCQMGKEEFQKVD
ncbi:MAG: rubredoxin [Candidatus Gastranaerophilales bacterium]|nr:rubredoxin [Candidatus Gastranaerophilales bacterium]